MLTSGRAEPSRNRRNRRPLYIRLGSPVSLACSVWSGQLLGRPIYSTVSRRASPRPTRRLPPSHRWPQVTEPPGIPVGVARRSPLQRVSRTASDAVQHRPSHSYKHGKGTFPTEYMPRWPTSRMRGRDSVRCVGPCRRVRKPRADLSLVHFFSVGDDSQLNEQAGAGNEIDAPEAMLMILVQSFWEVEGAGGQPIPSGEPVSWAGRVPTSGLAMGCDPATG